MDWSVWLLQRSHLMQMCLQQGPQPLLQEAWVAVSTKWHLTQLAVLTSAGAHQKQAMSSINCSRETRPVPAGIFSHPICHHSMHGLQMCSIATVCTHGKAAALGKSWNCCSCMNVIYCLWHYGQCLQEGIRPTPYMQFIQSTRVKPSVSRTKVCLWHLIYCTDLYANLATKQKHGIHYVCLISLLQCR